MNSYRDTILEVNLDHFEHNYNYFKDALNKSVFTVVKANAYGLGAVTIAQVAVTLGTDYLCTATLDEALELRNNGIQHPILVMGHTDIENLNIALKHHITITIASLEWAQALSKQPLSGLKLHLKINTRMNRLGVTSLEEAQEVLNLLQHHEIEGIFTHYYSKDVKAIDADFITFKSIVDQLNHHFKWIHASNSYAALHYPEHYTNAARIGIGLYGGTNDAQLKNVACFKTKVKTIRKINCNSSVSYDGIDTVKTGDLIAVLPIGYADGFSRLQQGSNVIINHKPYPIIGAICMDQMMVKIDDTVSINDIVELFGQQISIQIRAQLQQTISYEILTSISRRVPRTYIKNNKEIKRINYLL